MCVVRGRGGGQLGSVLVRASRVAQAVGCGVCDTPRSSALAWRRGLLYARVRAYAGAASKDIPLVPPNLYIHTYTYTLCIMYCRRAESAGAPALVLDARWLGFMG